MYHIIANLELMFGSLQEAQAWADSRPEIKPRVPETAMPGEDKTTPRICGAESLTRCATALALMGAFRRCLAANPDAKNYGNYNECYPIMVLEFSDSLGWMDPGPGQVPDLDITHEKWLLAPARPESAKIMWVTSESVLYGFDKKNRPVCEAFACSDGPCGMDHPWVNGCGHPLDSSGMGTDPWPDIKSLLSHLYYDDGPGACAGFALPCWPPDGRCEFRPLDPNKKPYMAWLAHLRRFTGFFDMHRHPIFQGFSVKYRSANYKTVNGDVGLSDDGMWQIAPWDGMHPIALNSNYYHNKSGVDRILPWLEITGSRQKIALPPGLLP